MTNHRLPIADGNRLELKPSYTLRFALVWVFLLAWGIVFLLANVSPDSLSYGQMTAGLAQLGADLLTPIVIFGSVALLRGKYLCLDRKLGKIEVAEGYSGKVGSWEPRAAFSPDGTMRLQYCRAELQHLCLLSYQHPGETDWTLLCIYSDMVVARQVAGLLRQWEPRLVVTEVDDQSAVALARQEKPLVD